MAKIYITQFDYDRLVTLLAKRKPHDEYDKALLAELEKAEIVGPEKIPENIITMNSQVRLEDEQGDEQEYWLVFPEEADLSDQKISILSPLGCALIGYGKGDAITIPTPNGHRELIVTEVVHQPEREGKFGI